MDDAIRLAEEAAAAGEVPVGAVLVCDGAVVARARNRMRERADPRAHAEMLALDAACRARGSGRLDGATLVVTLEPCPMCAGAIVLTRVARVVFGAWDPRLGACGSQFDVMGPGLLGDVRVRAGVAAERCGALLTDWFRGQRDAAAAGDDRSPDDRPPDDAERCQSG